MENLLLLNNLYNEYIFDASSEIIFLMKPSSPSTLTTGFPKIIGHVDVLTESLAEGILKPKSDGGRPVLRGTKIVGSFIYKTTDIFVGGKPIALEGGSIPSKSCIKDLISKETVWIKHGAILGTKCPAHFPKVDVSEPVFDSVLNTLPHHQSETVDLRETRNIRAVEKFYRERSFSPSKLPYNPTRP